MSVNQLQCITCWTPVCKTGTAQTPVPPPEAPGWWCRRAGAAAAPPVSQDEVRSRLSRPYMVTAAQTGGSVSPWKRRCLFSCGPAVCWRCAHAAAIVHSAVGNNRTHGLGTLVGIAALCPVTTVPPPDWFCIKRHLMSSVIVFVHSVFFTVGTTPHCLQIKIKRAKWPWRDGNFTTEYLKQMDGWSKSLLKRKNIILDVMHVILQK